MLYTLVYGPGASGQMPTENPLSHTDLENFQVEIVPSPRLYKQVELRLQPPPSDEPIR